MKFCDNEHLCITAMSGLAEALPRSSMIAYATDCQAGIGSWDLTSDLVDFEARGVSPGMVARVESETRKGHLGAGGTLYVVVEARGRTLTLRRPGFEPGVGEPVGGPTGLMVALALVFDLTPQIEDVSYRLASRYGISSGIAGQGPDDIADPRQLREPAALRTIASLYWGAWREGAGDIWKHKAAAFEAEAKEIENTTTLRWKNMGWSPYSSPISAVVTR